MINTICLDKNYSTTRLLVKEKPEIVKSLNDTFETVLFLVDGQERKGQGGLRMQGYFKKSYEDKPLISVVTVVYNGEAFLEETILSVINQSYDNVEYIIIDGGSSDGTIDIIKKYENAIDYWVSENDSGIYDAMNKGIDLVSGEWINFMNAGDQFYDAYVLKSISFEKIESAVDIVYGNYKVLYQKKSRIAQSGSVENLWKGSQFSHQSAFIRTTLHKQNFYNLNNKIVADFEFFYHSYCDNVKFKYINKNVATITAGGISDIKRIDGIISMWNILEKNTKINLYYIFRVLKEMLKIGVKFVLKGMH